MTESQHSLTPEEGAQALKLARQSLEHYVRTGELLKHEAVFSGGLSLPCGAFVSVHTKQEELRGCIGHMIGDGPLGELIIELAVKAGTEDPRFQAVTEDELGNLKYEISILSPMKRTDAEAVTPGVHGLYIKRGRASGVLLPQVAVEWKWDREQFLEHTCGKAGLPEGAWREAETEIYTFTAQIFSEDET